LLDSGPIPDFNNRLAVSFGLDWGVSDRVASIRRTVVMRAHEKRAGATAKQRLV
jgi:hypothetical protein